MENLTAASQGERRQTVWINEAEHIASFHAVEGYTVQAFANHEFFISYLFALQQRGFRFQ